MRKTVIAIALLLAIDPVVGSAQRPANSTSGACSPIVISSQNVSVHGCGLSEAAAKRLQDSIGKTIVQNNLTQAQIRVLVSMLNEVIGQNSIADQKLDRIINDLENSGSAEAPSRPLGQSNLVRETLDRTVQKVSDLKIILTRVESGAGRISIYFDIVNEGIVEYKNIDVFGGGSFGNGGSSIVMGGREILASGVEFAGQGSRGLVRVNLLPRILYTGRVDFEGVYGDAAQIDAFKLAFSDNNLRPSARAVFLLGSSAG